MMMKGFIVCLCIFLPQVNCLQWQTTPNDGITITACAGTDVTFPWEFTLDQGDLLHNQEWLFNGPPQELLAFNSHGSFVPLPGFADRLQHGNSGGLTLRHVTPNDRGSYSIEIHGNDASGTGFRLIRTVLLNVTDFLLTVDKPLEVSALPVHDDSTDLWSFQLTCGHFDKLQQPSFSVEWHGPSGRVFNSTGYINGQFLLELVSPLETGHYTCLIPDRFSGLDCLPDTNLTALGKASIFLDYMEVRLKLLEAQQNSLRKDNLVLKVENEDLQQRLKQWEDLLTGEQNRSEVIHAATQDLVQTLGQKVENNSQAVKHLNLVVDQHFEDLQNVTSLVATLQQDSAEHGGARIGVLEEGVKDLKNASLVDGRRLSSLNNEVRLLENIHMQDKIKMGHDIQAIQAQLDLAQTGWEDVVSFHAQLDHNVAQRSGETLVLPVLYNNNGQAYDNVTGIFTAPRDGTYFFVASTGSYNRSHDAYVELVVDGQQLALAFAHSNRVAGEMSTCHGVANLKTGQQVWLKTMLDSFYNYADTFFSGFRI